MLRARRVGSDGGARSIDPRPLLWTAAAQAVGFILANVCLSFLLLFLLMYAHAEHD